MTSVCGTITRLPVLNTHKSPRAQTRGDLFFGDDCSRKTKKTTGGYRGWPGHNSDIGIV